MSNGMNSEQKSKLSLFLAVGVGGMFGAIVRFGIVGLIVQYM
ncbi:MAG TPA: hypothetical protein VF095_02350 [Bacillota bacterium]